MNEQNKITLSDLTNDQLIRDAFTAQNNAGRGFSVNALSTVLLGATCTHGELVNTVDRATDEELLVFVDGDTATIVHNAADADDLWAVSLNIAREADERYLHDQYTANGLDISGDPDDWSDDHDALEAEWDDVAVPWSVYLAFAEKIHASR